MNGLKDLLETHLDHLGYDELVAATRLPGGRGVRPHPRQSIAAVARVLADLRGDVVVLAFDGLSWEAARAAFAPDTLIPLTTVFPSTSVSAWLTALTGRPVHEHRVPGVGFRSARTAELYDCFGGSGDGLPPPTGREPPAPVFAELARQGVRCAVNPGELATWPVYWQELFTRGATVLDAAADWDRIRDDPGGMADAAVAELDRPIEPGPEGLLVWSWINADDHVHAHGYTPALLDALRRLGGLAERLAGRGRSVLACSDHGLVPSSCPPALQEGWADATGPGRCALPPGGAGRVRWCYPRPGRAAEVERLLSDLLGEDAFVVPAGWLDEAGLLSLDAALARAIGDVVCVATDAPFPVPDPGAAFEHGSITPEEMIVPLAIWNAR
jgi:hypothetical protein